MKIQKTTLCLAALLMTTNVLAEDWDWRIAPYIWTAGISGDVTMGGTTADIDASFSDILDNLDFAAMLWVEAGKEDFSLYGNFIYMDLKEDATTPLGGTATTKLESVINEFGYFRKSKTKPNTGWEIGARYYSMRTEIIPAMLPSISDRENWFDGYVGYRIGHKISENWHFYGRATLGTGGSDYSWSLAPTFYREFESGNRLNIGFRALKIDYETNTAIANQPIEWDLTFSGFIIGYSFD